MHSLINMILMILAGGEDDQKINPLPLACLSLSTENHQCASLIIILVAISPHYAAYYQTAALFGKHGL